MARKNSRAVGVGLRGDSVDFGHIFVHIYYYGTDSFGRFDLREPPIIGGSFSGIKIF